MEAKNALYAQLAKIKDSEIRRFTTEVLEAAPEGFWTIPCSGSGRFHPPEDQGENGLVRHLIKCVFVAEDLCLYFGLSQEDKDIVLAAVLLHDVKKNGDPWGKVTAAQHGKLGADFLDKFALKEPAKTEIKDCVRYHMYRFTGTQDDVTRASKPSLKEQIVQLTDLFSSRKYASWLPGVNVSQEEIEKFLKKF